MSKIDRGAQKWILATSAFMLVYGIYCIDQSVRAGRPIVEMRGVVYTHGLAVFIMASIILISAAFLISSFRNLKG
ncbi:hypothetical protein WCE55_04985 [Luteimonas sp. MJ293]|uniref:hypothetical protein n=1 Tax=Luteimonas sp. MJ146 TaxID=3129240 RepID=UPI0031BA41A0